MLPVYISLISYPHSGLQEQKVRNSCSVGGKVTLEGEGVGEWGVDKKNQNVCKRVRQYGGEITGEKREEK